MKTRAQGGDLRCLVEPRLDPATGNTATVSLPSGAPAGQFSEVEAYPTS